MLVNLMKFLINFLIIANIEDVFVCFVGIVYLEPAIIFHVIPSGDMSKLHDDFKYLRSPFIKLQINKPCIFGRTETLDVPLSDSNVSREQMELSSAVIKIDTETFECLEFKVENLSKLNPVKINNLKLCKGKKAVLKRNDIIEIGRNSFRVEIHCTHYNNSEGTYWLGLSLPPKNSPDDIIACSIF